MTKGPQWPSAIIGHIPAGGFKGQDLIPFGSPLDPVPAFGPGLLVGLVSRQTKDRHRTGIDLRKLGTRINVTIAWLHQRLLLKVTQSGQIDQAAERLRHGLQELFCVEGVNRPVWGDDP